RRLEYRRDRPRHLAELGILLGREVFTSDLISVEETEAIRQRSIKVVREPGAKWEIPFREKSEPRFARFIAGLAAANGAGVYVWTPTSRTCGLIRPMPLSVVGFGFPFSMSPDGILSIVTEDLADKLLLDYFRDDQDEERLEIEVKG